MINLNLFLTVLLESLFFIQTDVTVLGWTENSSRDKIVVCRILVKDLVFWRQFTSKLKAMCKKFSTFLGDWHQLRYAFNDVANSINVVNVSTLFFIRPSDYLF